MNHGNEHQNLHMRKRIYTIASFLKGTSDRDTDLSNFQCVTSVFQRNAKRPYSIAGMQAYSILEMLITGRGMGK
jgi:hypothetical protein